VAAEDAPPYREPTPDERRVMNQLAARAKRLKIEKFCAHPDCDPDQIRNGGSG